MITRKILLAVSISVAVCGCSQTATTHVRPAPETRSVQKMSDGITYGYHEPQAIRLAAGAYRIKPDTHKPVVRVTVPEPAPVVTVAPVSAGLYSCSMLAALWVAVGGNPSEAFTASEVATAESGGRADAVSPTDDIGLWQINSSWGALATFSPEGNARAAVIISHDGADWTPWTTYRDGAFAGRC